MYTIKLVVDIQLATDVLSSMLTDKTFVKKDIFKPCIYYFIKKLVLWLPDKFQQSNLRPASGFSSLPCFFLLMLRPFEAFLAIWFCQTGWMEARIFVPATRNRRTKIKMIENQDNHKEIEQAAKLTKSSKK